MIAAAEARGFIFGAPLALELNAGFVPIRKPGKLPYATIAQEYQLEYGSDRLEVHTRRVRARPARALDRRRPGHRRNDARLPRPGRSTGADVVACAFLIELSFLGGRAKLEPGEIYSLITY